MESTVEDKVVNAMAAAIGDELNDHLVVTSFGKEYHFPRKINTNDRTHYMPDELAVFAEVIDDRMKRATLSRDDCKSAVNGSDSNDVTDTSPTFKVLEEGANTQSKENSGRLATRQDIFILKLEEAKIRIGNGTYGICRETGKLISPERLVAVPHCTTSIKAKNNQK